jgi:hypothetical protein
MVVLVMAFYGSGIFRPNIPKTKISNTKFGILGMWWAYSAFRWPYTDNVKYHISLLAIGEMPKSTVLFDEELYASRRPTRYSTSSQRSMSTSCS